MGVQETNLLNIAKALRTRGHSGSIQASTFHEKIKQLPSFNRYIRPDPTWNEEGAMEAVAIAQSYITAITNGRTFVYKAGAYGIFDGVAINDENGAGIMDCSTFIGLILRGIAYEDSPYATGDISDITARTDLYEWADTSLDTNDIRYACDYGEYMFKTGRVLYDMRDLRPGDILFHKNDNSVNNFGKIWHVSIVGTVGGTTCYHCLYGDSSKPIRAFVLSSMSDYLFAARPNYGAVESDNEPVTANYLTPPWYSLPSSGTAIKGVTFTLNDDSTVITTSGTSSAYCTCYLVDKTEPFVLEAGTYKLSGCPARTDGVSAESWNINLYDIDGSSSTLIARDSGSGAEFTLTSAKSCWACMTIAGGIDAEGYVWTPSLVKVA